MSDQKQRADANSVAIQSGRDTNVHHHHGVTIDEVRQIVEMVAAEQRAAFKAIAAEKVEERLRDYDRRLIERFSDPSKANPEAFKDPDFQYLLSRTQHAFARSGDAGVRDILIDLISSRSKQTDRTRLSLTLNDAVEKAAVLTKNEFAELTLCYLVRYSQFDLRNLTSFGDQFTRFVSPLLTDISRENASYMYIQAQSCGAIEEFPRELVLWLRASYFGIFSGGFESEHLARFFSEDRIKEMRSNQLIIPCINDPTKLQLNVLNRKSFEDREEVRQMPKNEQDNLWSIFDSSVWNGEAFFANVEPVYPDIRTLKSLWDDTALKQISLTTIGIAIGHANISRLYGFSPDLGIWLK